MDEDFAEEGKRLPCVIYCPKYDQKLREEYEVVAEDGFFIVYTTKIGQREAREEVGRFGSYSDARDAMFVKFFKDFDRPSKSAIEAGWSPNQSVWDRTRKGMEVKHSISIIEGTKEVKVTEITPKKMKIEITKPTAPTIISVHNIYPSYLKSVRQKHEKAVRRMARMKRIGFRRRKR